MQMFYCLGPPKWPPHSYSCPFISFPDILWGNLFSKLKSDNIMLPWQFSKKPNPLMVKIRILYASRPAHGLLLPTWRWVMCWSLMFTGSFPRFSCASSCWSSVRVHFTGPFLTLAPNSFLRHMSCTLQLRVCVPSNCYVEILTPTQVMTGGGGPVGIH